MDSYSFCLWLGFIGLIIMAFMGVAGGHGSHSHASHGADAHGFHLHGNGQHDLHLHGGPATHHHTAAPTPTGHASHASAAHSHGHAHAHTPSPGARILSYLSPRVLFAVSLGIGATGLLVAPYIPAEPLRALSALVGGIGLEKLAISPIWNVLMNFASKPARTLESAVAEEATAVTAFDTDGCGLVAIDLDGHEMRVLGRLNADQKHLRVRAGDRLFVEEVDAAKNQCRVSIIAA